MKSQTVDLITIIGTIFLISVMAFGLMRDIGWDLAREQPCDCSEEISNP